MHVIVPLAGPDYFQGKKPKGLSLSIDKSPQLKHTLNSRLWGKLKNLKYTFILKDSKKSRVFVEKYLKIWYSEASFIFLSKYTKGAAFSALSAISFQDLKDNEPLIFDLADIYFETSIFPDFENDFMDFSFIGYSFKSNLDKYSYYKIENDMIKYAQEKKVISNNASTGVYIYKNAYIFLEAFSKVLSNLEEYLHNDLLYLCPIVNGLIQNGKKGKLIYVDNYYDYKN